MPTRLTVNTKIKLSFKWVILGFVLSLSAATATHANLPTLGDPTLDSFSSKEERQLGLAFYRSLRANLTFIDLISRVKNESEKAVFRAGYVGEE